MQFTVLKDASVKMLVRKLKIHKEFSGLSYY